MEAQPGRCSRLARQRRTMPAPARNLNKLALLRNPAARSGHGLWHPALNCQGWCSLGSCGHSGTALNGIIHGSMTLGPACRPRPAELTHSTVVTSRGSHLAGLAACARSPNGGARRAERMQTNPLSMILITSWPKDRTNWPELQLSGMQCALDCLPALLQNDCACVHSSDQDGVSKLKCLGPALKTPSHRFPSSQVKDQGRISCAGFPFVATNRLKGGPAR